MKILITLLAMIPYLAAASSWEQRRNELEQVALYKQFRIFYSLSGKDKLPDDQQADHDNNGVPDFVESIGRRLVDADHIFRHDVKLTAPLDSKRYYGKAHYIDVNIVTFSKSYKRPQNGIAYDGTPTFNRSLTGQSSVKVLAIDLSGMVDLKTNTVEHELFHLYQNGYTYFKNRWFTEGTARWSESLLKGRIGSAHTLPDNAEQREELFRSSYAASRFWNQLILTHDSENLGKRFIRMLLIRLSHMDDVAAKERGIATDSWPEAEQKSKENDIYIWRAAIQISEELSRQR